MVDYLESIGLKESAKCLEMEGKVDIEAKLAAKGLLEKKWSTVLRLQKKLMQLEEENKQLKENVATHTGSKRIAAQLLPVAPPTHILKGHRGAVTSVRFHPQYPLLASSSEDATVKLWDTESGQFERTLKGHTNAVQCVAFSPTGTLLCSASADLSLKLWDMETNECIKTMHGHDHNVSAVVFMPNGDTVVSCSRDHSIRYWDVQTGYCSKTLHGHSEWVRAIAVSPAGDLLVSGGHDKSVRLWDAPKGTTLHEMFGHEHVIECVAFAPPQSNPWIEDLENAKDVAEKQTEIKYCVSGSRDKKIIVWDVKSGGIVMTLKGHENWVRDFVFHPSGKYLISTGDDYTIRIWDLSQQRVIKTIDNAHEHFIGTLHLSKLGCIATGDVENLIKLWKMQ